MPRPDTTAQPTIGLIVHVTCQNDYIATEVAEAILNEELSENVRIVSAKDIVSGDAGTFQMNSRAVICEVKVPMFKMKDMMSFVKWLNQNRYKDRQLFVVAKEVYKVKDFSPMLAPALP